MPVNEETYSSYVGGIRQQSFLSLHRNADVKRNLPVADSQSALYGIQLWNIQRLLLVKNDLRAANRKGISTQRFIAFEYPIIPDVGP